MFTIRQTLSIITLVLFCLITIVGPDSAALARPVAKTTGAPAAVQGQPPSFTGNKPSTITATDGAFHFTGLEPGTHQLYLDPATLPAGLRPPADAPRVSLWINPSQSLVSDSVGDNVRFSANYDHDGTTINGTVFLDRNRNGQRDPGETDLAGVTVIDPTVHQYFVPFNDDDLWTLFAEINDDGAIGQCLLDSPTSTDLNSFLSVTASSDGTIFYYDHWEDGYDADPLAPGASTQVGIIDAGVTHTFNNIVATPRLSSTLLYDGRDRITVFGEPASVIRAVYPVTLGPQSGEVLAGAWEVPEVSTWGRSFVAVIGEDLDFNGPGVADDFDYVGLQIMAAQANTQVWYNGTLMTTLRAGETLLIDGENNGAGAGGIDSSDMITATGPIQVQMLGANCSHTPFTGWSARAYTLQPRDKWNHDYWAPVPDFEESAWCNIDQDAEADDRDTDLYVHNPHANPMSVIFNDGGADILLNVPSGETISVLAYLNALGRDLNNLNSAHLYSDQEFWGLSTIDSISGNSATNSISNYNDWGYSLVPVNQLSSQVVLGWAPGNSLIPPTGDENGSLAFVTALTDAVVYVDFTQDGQPDAFDINGDGDANDLDVYFEANFDEPTSDDGIPLAAGQVLRVADPNDNDLTGAMIYTLDLSAKIAVAWGQDPCRAEPASPFLDLGYTVLPHPIPSLAKQDTLVHDADLSGDISPGDTLEYVISLHNSGKGPLLNAVLTDTLPYTYTDFVVGSLAVSAPPVLGSAEYFDGLTWGYTPVATPDGDDPAVQALRLSWPAIDAGQSVTITFRVLLDEYIPIEVQSISNQATFYSDGTGQTPSQDPDDPSDPDTDAPIGQPILQIDKIDEPDPVRPGELLTYTVVTTNTGTATALGVLVLEDLPAYTTYVPDTLDLTLPSILTETVTRTVPYTTTFTGSYADDFDLTVTQTTDYTGSDGTLLWTLGWNEVGDIGDPGTGDVQVGSVPGNELSPAGYLELTDTDGADSGVIRVVDLTDFVAPTLSFYVSGANNQDGDDTYTVSINGNPPLLTEEHDGPYQQRVLDLSAYAGGAITLELMTQAGLDAGETYRFDNMDITEASPLRSGVQTLENITSTLVYSTYSNINPVAYDPVANVMTVTNDIRIPPSAYVHMSFQVRVAIPLTNGMQLLNRAVITSTNVVTTPYPLEDTEPTTVLSSHALTITKQASDSIVQPGQIFSYTLFWQVGGDEPAPGLVVTDTLPWPYVSYVGCEGGLGCTYTAPDTVVWALGDRLPAASGITYDSGWLTLTVQAEWPPPPNGVFTNTAIIDDATDVPPDEDDEPVRVITHTLNITKTDNPYDPLAPGETFTYTMFWQVAGDGPAPDVTVTDTLPSPYVSFNACAGGLSCGETSPGSGVVVWDLGDQLLGGSTYDSGYLSLSVDTSLPLTDGLEFTNTVILDDATDVPPAWDDEPTTVLSSHVLTITKEDRPDTVYLGQRMTYTLFWEVAGDEPAPGLVVTDTLPWPYVSFVDCEGNCAFTAPDTVAWNMGDRLPPMSGITYESGLLTLTVRVERYPPAGVFTNTAIIDDDTDVPPDEDDEPTDVLNAGFILDKRLISPAVGWAPIGDPVQFLIVITNTGAVTLTELPLEDTYDPAYLAFQNALPSPDSITPTGKLTWNDLTLPPGSDMETGASVQITVTFTAISSTQDLDPPVTINTAVSDGALAGPIALPPVEDDAGVEIRDPTAIQLLYLRANPKLGGVSVEWATLFEIDTYGFWLYRSDDSQLDHAVPVVFTAAQGGPSLGATYQYLDTDLSLNLYHYWLVEIENSGRETTYGPVSAWPGWNEADSAYQVYLPVIQR